MRKCSPNCALKWYYFLTLKIAAAISHILHNLWAKKKVNLSFKMQKPFILIDNVKQFSNLMTWASIFASKKSNQRTWRLKQKLHTKSAFASFCRRVTICIDNINIRLVSFPHRRKQKVMLALLSSLIHSK